MSDVGRVRRIGKALGPVLGAGPRGLGDFDAEVSGSPEFNYTKREQQKNRQGDSQLDHGLPSLLSCTLHPWCDRMALIAAEIVVIR
ncbi:MAG TPA: hypothetical protein VN976_05710 [Verrucomicrobiae bacterium]|nr:hypothetical protein [Verrucomicrobiae bacterium]